MKSRGLFMIFDANESLRLLCWITFDYTGISPRIYGRLPIGNKVKSAVSRKVLVLEQKG
jgi:hypothetical protein